MAEKDSFILYTDQKAVIEKLSNEQAGQLIKAIYKYVDTGILPQLDSTLDLVITPFITTLDRDKQKYLKISEIRANARKGKQKKQMITKDNKCDDSDTDSDSDSDSDSGSSNIINKNDSCVDGFYEITNFYNDNIGALTPYSLEILNDYSKQLSKDLVKLAMKKAVEANKRTIQYIKAILNNWEKSGIKTIVEAETENFKFKQEKQQQKNNMTQREYSKQDLENLYVNTKE